MHVLGNSLPGFKPNPAQTWVLLPRVPQFHTCRTRTITLTSEQSCGDGMPGATQLRGCWETPFQPALDLTSDMFCLQAVSAQT